jgi:hypothetical protein
MDSRSFVNLGNQQAEWLPWPVAARPLNPTMRSL